jgi:hypothetical protein
MVEHLTDEQLTDVVDGAATGDVEGHLEACPSCRDRLAAVRAAVAAIATPPPPPTPAQRDAAVARALADPQARPGSAAPLRWLAAAAAVVVVLGVGGLVISRRDPGSQSTAANSTAAAPEGTTAGAGAVIDGGDLGDQRDPNALNTLLEGQLDGGATADSGAAALSAPAGSSPNDTPMAATAGKAAGRAAAPAPTCLAQAQEAGSGRVGRLVLTAQLRWQGDAAEVLVFETAGQTKLARRAFVMKRSDCRLLVVQSF